jgi:hypothetical protein
MTATEIVKLLGGDMAIARATGWGQSTINSWKKLNSIPEWRRAELLRLALTLNLPLSATDFPTRDERIAKGKVAA